MSQNGSSTTQVQTGQAPSWQQPYQQYGLQQATAQFQGINNPQQLVAGFSQPQNQAIAGIQNLATNNPTLGAAQNYETSVLNGNPAQNPYLSSEFNLGANDVQNRLESEFAGSGRNVVGSLPIQADELNNLATQLYGGAYNTGVQQQENALAAAPNTTNAQLGLQQGLYGAGQQIQNLGQQYIQAPQNFLQNYLNQVNQGLGQTQTTQQPLSTAQQIAQAGLGSQTGSTIGSTLGGLIGNYFGNQSAGSTAGSLLGAIGGAFA
ncbi:MAG: hypothetical protein KGH96_23575 [Sphingomonadales bacterium]|nr:hypothetical protein [Sphingomonadales bacterium]